MLNDVKKHQKDERTINKFDYYILIPFNIWRNDPWETRRRLQEPEERRIGNIVFISDKNQITPSFAQSQLPDTFICLYNSTDFGSCLVLALFISLFLFTDKCSIRRFISIQIEESGDFESMDM